jgi:hypothetical protein
MLLPPGPALPPEISRTHVVVLITERQHKVPQDHVSNVILIHPVSGSIVCPAAVPRSKSCQPAATVVAGAPR